MVTRAMRGWTILMLGGALALACPAIGGEKEKKNNDEKRAALASVAGSAGPTKADPVALPPLTSDYRIGINDVIDVHVWKEPELSRIVPVRPDGKISLPLIGDAEAKGLTPLELRVAITERLKAYVAQPEVTVIVREINSQRYFVMGQVERPGAYPLSAPTTVVQALAAAGGLREWARSKEITITRRTQDNRTERIRFNYKDWLKKKQADALQLRNGDVVVVP